MYSERDRARRHRESTVRHRVAGEDRGAFARDRARVLHSAALRRLAGKTQVVGPGEGDVPRTRLTHSLEVAQIGREIGAALGCDPDVVDTAGLAHDIGHPPFGHNGERVLDDIARDCGGFEGNAQTLRILTRLEPKVLGPGGRCFGLNLTRACLDAATKYPWPRTAGLAKYGVYAEDLEVFAWLRRDAPGNRRCLEAQVMDWSDDVAYSVHDVEDGILAGRIVLAQLGDAAERAELAGIAAKHFSHCSVGELEAAALRLLELEAVSEVAGSGGRRGYDGSFVALAALKQLTSDLVGRFATAAIAATRAAFPVSATDRYGADLLIPTGAAEEVAVLKAVALRYVMSDPGRLRVQREQRDRLAELTRALVCAAPHGLDPGFRAAFAEAPDDDASLRVVIDQVASLTDAQALGWHRRICLG